MVACILYPTFKSSGWLFEQTSTGWVVRVHIKHVASKTFTRAYDQWDVVSMFQSEDGHLRINSPRFAQNLCSPFVYREVLLNHLLGQSTERSAT